MTVLSYILELHFNKLSFDSLKNEVKLLHYQTCIRIQNAINNISLHTLTLILLYLSKLIPELIPLPKIVSSSSAGSGGM
jgi:hypothetical protein